MTAQPHILMCPPDFYGIEYEINAWMNTARQANHETAVNQWEALRRLIEQTGALVTLVPPIKGLPDLVFTANAGLIHKEKCILARFKHAQRQGEEPHFRDALDKLGLEIVEAPEELAFEGAGDALFCGDTLYAGYRMRSDAQGLQEIGGMLEVRVIPLELVHPQYYHVDTCLCPLSPEEAIYYPGAFDEYGNRALESHVAQLIAVEKGEAERFACNAVVIGKQVITNTGCDRLHEELRERGYDPIATPLDEFVKAGGSAKCLTLRIDGEEAADWKTSTDHGSPH